MTEDQPFTDDELRLLAYAWAVHHDGGEAFRPEDVYWPEAHRLCERGWLDRRWHEVDDEREMVFALSPQAEAAIDLANLTANVSPN